MSSEVNVIEGNKLIAKFMGGHQNAQGYWYAIGERQVKDGKIIRNGYYKTETFEYHISWDWLMPVIQKCDEVVKSEEILNSFSTYHVRYSAIIEGLRRLRLDQTYIAILKFIEWYNNNSTQ
jgi:hypothetical protein